MIEVKGFFEGGKVAREDWRSGEDDSGFNLVGGLSRDRDYRMRRGRGRNWRL